jgi:serine phosphatase RsbU (regulator of sigma subunit)
MEELLLKVARRLRPGVDDLQGRDRAGTVGNIFGVLYLTPLAAAGVIWLVAVTDLSIFVTGWPVLAGAFVLIYVFGRMDFFFTIEVKKNVEAHATGSPADVIAWGAALLLGPTALWPALFWIVVLDLRSWRREDPVDLRWTQVRTLVEDVAELIPTALIALALYQRWGGVFPLPELGVLALPAFYATFVRFALSVLFTLPFLTYLLFSPSLDLAGQSRTVALKFAAVSIGWPLLITPFGILFAGLLAEGRYVATGFVLAGTLFAGVLAHHLSKAVDRGRQRTREVERLEALGRAFLNAPADGSMLEEILEDHVGDMFSYASIEIRLFPERPLILSPAHAAPADEAAWDWLHILPEATFFPRGAELPWGGHLAGGSLISAPILDVDTKEPLGGVVVMQRLTGSDPERQLPAVQSLAAQIASALHRTREYERALEHQRIEQDLQVAAEIQASFMPRSAPDVPGWEMRATIDSAREASGDFLDLIPLSGGRWGILVADVSGKGIAAALYMALARTIIRTYAVEHEGDPELAVAAANRRILSDTDDELFVTAFYGVLDPATGELSYTNAGHNPPYLFRATDGWPVEELPGTGIPLGLMEGAEWTCGKVRFAPGDTLVVYTDGLPDAENEKGEPFGEERVVATARTRLGEPAADLRDALFEDVRGFIGDATRVDDITATVVRRQPGDDQKPDTTSR